MPRVIICVDMDAFFASVEQQANPALRGKPVCVIGSGGRTVITTSSYEARKYGIKTGMNIREAKKILPSIIFVIGDNEKYTHTCREMEKIYARFTPDLEIYSIDEAFLDITTTHHLFGGPEAIGTAIKKSVKEMFGINCTVGIGPNILIAKLASDISKPDGLRQVRSQEADALLRDLPVKELWGIGPKTAQRLASLRIKTCGELGRAPASFLRDKFGIHGETLKKMGMGIWERPLQTIPEDAKSVGHSMTLPRDIHEREEIEAYLLLLSEMIGRRARKHRYMGKKISLTIRYSDFETFSLQTTLPRVTNDTHGIFQASLNILNSIRLRDKVRLLGVCLSCLIRDPLQIPLITEDRKRSAVLHAVDTINDRYGDFRIIWGSYLKHKRHSGVISPSWKPSGVKNVHVK
jgi:DNA polymerase-4